MTFSIRRALGVAVVATAAGVAQLTAQGNPPPQVTVGGVVYTQYLYQLKDSVNHFNNFDITRAYVNVLGKFSGGVGTRVTADIYRNADGSLGYRLKYAFATYTPQGSPLTFTIGQIPSPWPGRLPQPRAVRWARSTATSTARSASIRPPTPKSQSSVASTSRTYKPAPPTSRRASSAVCRIS